MYNSLLPFILVAGPLLVASVFYRRGSRIFLFLAFIGAALWISYGLWSVEHSLILRFSTEICVSCLGLEAEEQAASLSVESVEMLRSLKNPVHIILFTSKHCKACPAAKRLLGLISNASNGMVKYVELDVAEHRAEAEEYGVRFVPTMMVEDVKIEGIPSERYLVSLIVEKAGG